MQIVGPLLLWNLDSITSIVLASLIVKPRNGMQWLMNITCIMDNQSQCYRYSQIFLKLRAGTHLIEATHNLLIFKALFRPWRTLNNLRKGVDGRNDILFKGQFGRLFIVSLIGNVREVPLFLIHSSLILEKVTKSRRGNKRMILFTPCQIWNFLLKNRQDFISFDELVSVLGVQFGLGNPSNKKMTIVPPGCRAAHESG
jgi:hypothetical protein